MKLIGLSKQLNQTKKEVVEKPIRGVFYNTKARLHKDRIVVFGHPETTEEAIKEISTKLLWTFLNCKPDHWVYLGEYK